MKFQLDTKEKIIRIEESVNLEELFETLKKILPNGEWKAFTLETNTTIQWSSPVVVPYYPYYPHNPYPWWQPKVTCFDTVGTVTSNIPPTPSRYSLAEGVYNIEIN